MFETRGTKMNSEIEKKVIEPSENINKKWILPVECRRKLLKQVGKVSWGFLPETTNGKFPTDVKEFPISRATLLFVSVEKSLKNIKGKNTVYLTPMLHGYKLFISNNEISDKLVLKKLIFAPLDSGPKSIKSDNKTLIEYTIKLAKKLMEGSVTFVKNYQIDINTGMLSLEGCVNNEGEWIPQISYDDSKTLGRG